MDITNLLNNLKPGDHVSEAEMQAIIAMFGNQVEILDDQVS